MTSYKLRPRKSHPISKTLRIDRRPSTVGKSVTRAGQLICRKFGVLPAVADVIADLAGLGSATES